MFFWLFLDIFILFLLCISQISKESVSRKCCYLTVVLLFLLTTFRYETGTDTMSYLLDDFYLIYFDIDNIYKEYSFEIIIETLRENGFSSQTLFMVYAIPTYLFFWKGLRYYLDTYRDILVALFFFSVSLWAGFWETMNIMRAMLSTMILFWGSRYLVENKKMKFLLVILLAIVFHYSSIAAIILLLIPYKKVGKMKLYLCYALSLILMSLHIDELPYMLMAYGVEVTRGSSQIGNTSGVGLILAFLICEVLLCTYYTNYKNRKNVILMSMLALGLCLRITFFHNNILAGRISSLFVGCFPVVLVYAMNLMTKDERFKKGLVIIASAIMIFAQLNASYDPLKLERGPMADPYQYNYRIEFFRD